METKECALVHDTECERMVIGSLFMYPDQYGVVAENLTSECFYDKTNLEVWQGIESVHKKGLKLDYITLFEYFNSIGSTIEPATIFSYGESFHLSNLPHYAERLAILAKRRRMWQVGEMMKKAGESEVDDIDELSSKLLSEIDSIFGFYTGGMCTMTDAIETLQENMMQNMSKGSAITGTPTGFRKLDEKGGLHRSNLIIVAGETSQGKTSFATALARSAIQNQQKVAFYSMEMENHELAARMLSMECGVPANDILYSGDLSPTSLEAIDKARANLESQNLYFDDNSNSSIDKIISSIETMKRKFDIDGAVVDYLQILNVNQKSINKEQAMGEASRRLKNIAKDLKIWVIALSQLSRDSNSPQPNLNRLRDSGQIAEAADVVMLVYRPEFYHRTFPEPFSEVPVEGKAMIDVAKGRNIGTFRFICDFDRHLTLFKDTQDDVVPSPFVGASSSAPMDDAPF